MAGNAKRGKETTTVSRRGSEESPFVKWLLIGVALIFSIVFLLLPLVNVFAQAFSKGFDVIALRADRDCHRTSEILASREPPDQMAEIVLRLPAEFISRQRVDVNAIDARWHLPSAGCVYRFVFGNAPFRRPRGIDA